MHAPAGQGLRDGPNESETESPARCGSCDFAQDDKGTQLPFASGVSDRY